MDNSPVEPPVDTPADTPAGDPAPWWQGKMPDDIAALDDVQNSKDERAFWGQYQNLRSKIGNSISIPSEDASAEDRQAFYGKLASKVPGLAVKPGDDPESVEAFYNSMGRPKSADKYSTPELDVPEGVELNSDIMDTLRPIAHKNGLTDTQFKAIYTELANGSIQAAAESANAEKAAQAELKQKWGAAFDVNSIRALKVAKDTGAPDFLVEAIEAGTAPTTMLEYFSGLAKTMGSEPNQMNSMHGSGSIMDPATAGEKISEIMNNPKHAYWNKSDPANAAAVARMTELYRIKNPDNKVVATLG